MKIKIYFKRGICSKNDVKRVMKQLDLSIQGEIERDKEIELVTTIAFVETEFDGLKLEAHSEVAFITFLK